MNDICNKLHNSLNSLSKHSFLFDDRAIPANGIYILFEEGEYAHGTKRIVRIGTHTGANQLPSRLKQHFVNQNKDRSIFRKNIGRSFLNKGNEPFLQKWEIDLTTKKAKEKYKDIIDQNKKQELEEKVSKYIQDNFSFVVFEVTDKNKRLVYESKIISTVSLCQDCNPSKNWLGNFSTKRKIQESGLWQVNELYKERLNKKELDELMEIIF